MREQANALIPHKHQNGLPALTFHDSRRHNAQFHSKAAP
jgi:hypothetical protein